MHSGHRMQISKSGVESSFGRGRFFAFILAHSHVCKLPANFRLSSDSEENSEDVRNLLLTVSLLKMCDFERGQIVNNILKSPRVGRTVKTRHCPLKPASEMCTGRVHTALCVQASAGERHEHPAHEASARVLAFCYFQRAGTATGHDRCI